MAFIDEVTLHLKAGDGGNGVVAWLHEKGREFMGPAGGDGGKGGDVFAVAVSNISKLADYRFGTHFSAERGEHGEGKSRHGKDGGNLDIELPIGSVIRNLDTGRSYELLTPGQRLRILHGGRGGFGNEHFKSSRNVRPCEATPGRLGEKADFLVELRLFADVGFIGLPNAGKSSLLNELTRARAKVAPYAFTTLEPNLGVFEGFVLADIPGLIEGASAGKGLGTKFLRHIARTKLLLHCVAADEAKPQKSYETVRTELMSHAPELAEKREVIVLTKADTQEEQGLKKTLSALKKKNKDILTVSIIDDELLKSFKERLLRVLNKPQ
jgi:GTP-binding protein